MSNNPSLQVGVDEITLVLVSSEKVDISEWIDKLEIMVGNFITLSKLENLFGELVPADFGLQKGYTNALTVPNRPWHLTINWNEDFPNMGVCVKFSAYAYAVYKSEYQHKFNQSINISDFLYMVQDDSYTTRLSRIDLTADYKNYDDSVNPNVIYKKLKYDRYIIKDSKNRQMIKTKSALDKNGSYETIYIGSRKSKTNGFLRIYNKRLEQLETKGFRYDEARNCDSWIRFEAVFRGTYAHQITDELLNNVNSPMELQQFIASKITEKYRFYNKKPIHELGFTTDLLNLAKGANFNALRCESPRNNTLRQSILYIKNNSGLFSLLFKVYAVWGDKAEKELLEYLYKEYQDDFKENALKNKELKVWINKNLCELKKLSLKDFL